MKIAILLILFLGSLVTLESADIYSKFMRLASDQISQGFDETSAFSAAEKAFYSKLSSDRKRAFVQFSQGDKDAALSMTKKHLPEEALMAAVVYDIKTLPANQQAFYNRLSDKGKKIFFVLNDQSSDVAASLADKMPADEALMKGLDQELAAFIPDQKAFYESLSPDNQILYLSLSDRTQENLALDSEAAKDPNKAVLEAQKKDADRLYKDQRDFYDLLSVETRVLFLSLTPDARGLAVSLTRGVDPAKAVDYLVALHA